MLARLRFLLCGVWLLLNWSPLAAQQLILTAPSDPTVCGLSGFAVTVLNDSDEALTNLVLSLAMPPCISLPNVGNPDSILLDDIAAGASLTLEFEQLASCNCLPLVNAGELFTYNATLGYTGGMLQSQAADYEMETPLLVITNVSNTFLVGSKGQTLQRSITIQNTRLGALSSFVFRDQHQGGISVSANLGTVLNQSAQLLEIELTGADFESIGNGNALFEFNESITITETILIESCGILQNSSLSTLQVAWGCESATCQQTSKQALVQILPSNLEPALVFEPFGTGPSCFCNGANYPQGLRVINQGEETALNVFLQIQLQQDSASILGNSVQIDSAGTTIPGEINLGSPLVATSNSCAGDDAFKDMVIILQQLSPGDTVTLLWNEQFCSNGCNSSLVRWRFKSGFEKPCPPGAYELIDFIEFENPGIPSPQASWQIPGSLPDQSQISVPFELQHDSLSTANGTLHLNWTLPCGTEWLPDNELLLDGVAPGAITLNPQADGGLRISAQYALPLAQNSSSLLMNLLVDCSAECLDYAYCLDSIQSSCPLIDNCALTDDAPELNFAFEVSMDLCGASLASCGLQTCGVFSAELACEPDSICLRQPPGYFLAEFKAERLNFGLPDLDDNRIPDAPGTPLDTTLLRRDRLIPGDTLLLEYSAGVFVDQPDSTLTNARLDLVLSGANFDPDFNAGILETNGWNWLDSELQLYQASTNTWYSCPDLSPQILSSDGLSYRFSLHPDSLQLIGCTLPNNFHYQQGDSIKLSTRLRYNYNLLRENPLAPGPPIALIFAEGRASFVDPETNETGFLCGCGAETLEVTGYEPLLLPGLFAVPPCDTSSFSGASLIGMVLGAPNFFPYEVRPLSVIEELQLVLPNNFTLIEAQLLRVDLQNGPTVLNQTPLIWNTQADSSTINLSSLPFHSFDEGFSALLQYRFTADCQIQSAYPLQLAALFNNLPNASVLPDTLWEYALSETALRALNPNLTLNAPLTNYLSSDNQGVWEFSLTNAINTIAGQSSGIAPEVWVWPQSQNGQLSNFQLINTETQEYYISNNGIFQIGDLDTLELKNLLLIAQNSSCLPEQLQLLYGWNCTPYTDPDSEACYTSSIQLGVVAPPGELEMQVFGPDDCALLCDTIGYHRVRLINAGQGAQCQPYINLFLQNGFQLIPGSVQVAYPAGSAFVAAPDPIPLGNGLFQWDLSLLSSDIDSLCLPGLNSAPYNELELRFLGLSDCDFIANSKLVFRAGAKQLCGTNSNLVVRQSPPICIEFEEQIPEGFVNVQLAQPLFCADTALLSIAMLADASSQSGDSLQVWLPPGLSYVPGSFAGLMSPPASEPLLGMEGDQQLLRWAWPLGLAPFQASSFQIAVAGLRSLPCGTEVLTARTTREAEAVCALTGDTCSIQVETGSLLFNLPIERPSYSLGNFTVQTFPDSSSNFGLEIIQSGPVFNEPVIVDFYLDLDNNGVPSSGDSLVFSQLAGTGINGQQLLSGALPQGLGVSDLCKLIAWIDPAQHCVCSSELAAVQQPIQYQTAFGGQLCSGASQEFSLCFEDFEYQWQPAVNWSCDTCCTSTFSLTLSDADASTVSLSMEASQAGCSVLAEFELLVTPLPGIAYADTLVCTGQVANLLAGPAAEILWSGPGIVEAQLQAQSLIPDESAWYFVQLTDSLGCYGEDSVWIEVLPPIQANAGDDLVFCPGDSAFLQPIIDANLQYLWSPAYLLNDPTAAQAVLISQTDTDFQLTLTDAAGCQLLDSVSVRFAENPVLVYEPERLLCAGDADTLQVSGALEYFWNSGVECLNPPLCSQVLVQPDTSTVYSFTALNDDGCSAEGAITVTLIEESLSVLDTLNFCAGEVTMVFDELVSESGRYCDTLSGPGACLVLECFDLIFADTFRMQQDTVVCPGDVVEFQGESLTEAGLYWWTGSTEAGCDSLIGLELNWHPVEEVFLSQDSLLLRKGSSAEIELFGPAETWSWAPPEGLSCDDCPNPEVSPLESTLYLIETSDANGCRQTLELWVAVEVYCELEEIQVPNAFSPNNDGLNDIFEPLAPEGLEFNYVLQVFNRWGERIFFAENQGWDGMQKGQPSPMENYVYLLSLRCANGLEEERRGSLLLVR